MVKCAYCAEPLPDSDDEECDEGKEEDDGGCGEGGFCDDFCREMKEDDRRWDQETLGFSLSEQLAKACFLGDENRVENSQQRRTRLTSSSRRHRCFSWMRASTHTSRRRMHGAQR